MKRFRFSLESVLKLRLDQEEEAERALASARQALAAVERQGQLARNELHDCWSHSRSAMQGGTPVCQIEHARHYAASVQEKIKALELRRKQAAEAADKAAVKLRLARQKREVLEKLRERRFGVYRARQSAWEQRETDERATAAYARNCAGLIEEVAP